MNKTEQIRRLMAELKAITGLGTNCVSFDGMHVIEGKLAAKGTDLHYHPYCPFFGSESCLPHWLRPPVADGLIHCPDGHCFAHVPLLDGDLSCGLILLGPLPQYVLQDDFQMGALYTLLQSFACLMEKRGLLPRRNDTFAAISHYVSSHLTDDLSMETMQAHLYLSASTISRVVKQESGLPLRLYIQYRRLEAARWLLLTTSLPIIQIAEQCGINDFNYFSRIFKKQYGMSPTNMRSHVAGRTFK